MFSIDLGNNQLTSIDGLQRCYNSIVIMRIEGNPIKDLTPMCKIHCEEFYMAGNSKPHSYSPVSYIDACDFEYPKGFISFLIKDHHTCLMDRDPVRIKGQDIYVSPKYLLYWLGFTCDIKSDRITLNREEVNLLFTNKGRTMTYKGKSYTSPYSPYVKEGVTYIPIKFMVNKLGGKLKRTYGPDEYNEETTYEITLPKEFDEKD